MKLFVGCLFAFLAFMVIGTMMMGLASTDSDGNPHAPVIQSKL